MQKFYTVGEAAARAGVTAETLRHYDRIGLVAPSETDRWTGYRRYSEEDIIRIKTVAALKSMGFSLREIGSMLKTEKLDALIDGFERALRQADEKIAALQEAKRRIAQVKAHYAGKLRELPAGASVKILPERAVLLSERPISPTVETLHDYLRHFYAQVGETRRPLFSFADEAGIYESEGKSMMFAVCERRPADADVLLLPGGEYLCAGCTEETNCAVLKELLIRAEQYGVPSPPFVLRMIRLTGILSWEYELRLPLSGEMPRKSR